MRYVLTCMTNELLGDRLRVAGWGAYSRSSFSVLDGVFVIAAKTGSSEAAPSPCTSTHTPVWLLLLLLPSSFVLFAFAPPDLHVARCVS